MSDNLFSARYDLSTVEGVLVDIIRMKGNCENIAFCNRCPIYYKCDYYEDVINEEAPSMPKNWLLYSDNYQRAVEKYIELFGREGLLEVLI